MGGKKKPPPILMWVVANEISGDVVNGYLKSYDPHTPDGRGYFETTDSRDEAMKFADLVEFHECWTQVSNTRPTRPDGKPNRPLTAFTVQSRPVERETGESWTKNRWRGSDES